MRSMRLSEELDESMRLSEKSDKSKMLYELYEINEVDCRER